MKKWIFRAILWSNVLIALTTLAGLAASYIDPAEISWPQMIGLFMPWLFLANFFFATLWMSLRKKWFWISTLMLALGSYQLTRFVGFHFGKDRVDSQISLCTFNSQNYNKSDHLIAFLNEIRDAYQLDFLCLQEVTNSNQLKTFMQNSGLNHHYAEKGKAILSRYPIEDSGIIQFDNSVNGCVWIDVVLEGKKVRIFNLHLKSNKVTQEAESMMKDINKDRAKAWTNIKRMLANYGSATKARRNQVQGILETIVDTEHPVIVAGDLNDTPFSFTYQQFANILVDHFKAKGLGIGSTYAGSLPGLKIDYIFADDFLELKDHIILKTEISDHFPVISFMKTK